MCGIAGIILKSGSPDRETLDSMSGLLAHRGPDDEGVYMDGRVGLVHRRLSILDLSDAGHQPMSYASGRYWIVYNGEVYNFVELRNELASMGYVFESGSDTEVVLAAYDAWGRECLARFRGMFAFAIYDRSEKSVFFARDRMGEKPLYLYEDEGRLIFASELKALVASGAVPFELDPVSVDLYFHYHYIPEPFTPLKGVRKLAAGHSLTIELEEWRISEHCYWRMEDAPPLEGDPARLIRERLDEISGLIIRSDVPVGVALSGGLDSSAIAAMASKKYPGAMHAFSVGYRGRPQSDERTDAKALADHLGIPFHDVELSCEEVVEFFPELVAWRDDPIADISGQGYYSVMKLAAEQGVKVMLQGHGGDELFWGYPWVRRAAVESQKKTEYYEQGLKLGDYITFELPKGLSRIDVSGWVRSFGGLRTGWERYRRLKASPAERMVFYDISVPFQAACKSVAEIYSTSFAESVKETSAFDVFTRAMPWPRPDIEITRLICQTYLLENGIAQGDRLSMASSVEMRLPLVDYRLVETVIGLRKNNPDHRLEPKAWLKSALRGILPEWVMKRRKRGFEPPVLEWHRAIFAAHGSMLDDGYLVEAGVLGREGARRLSKGPYPARGGTPLSFKALVLEVWCRRMLSVVGAYTESMRIHG